MNFTYCRQVYMAYKKEKSKRKVSKLFSTLPGLRIHMTYSIYHTGLYQDYQNGATTQLLTMDIVCNRYRVYR